MAEPQRIGELTGARRERHPPEQSFEASEGAGSWRNLSRVPSQRVGWREAAGETAIMIDCRYPARNCAQWRRASPELRVHIIVRHASGNSFACASGVRQLGFPAGQRGGRERSRADAKQMPQIPA